MRYDWIKTVIKMAWAAGAGFVAFIVPDLVNLLIVYVSDPANQAAWLGPIPPAWKPFASMFLLAWIAGLKNWASNHKKGQ